MSDSAISNDIFIGEKVEKNKIASLLEILAWIIYVSGFIAGFVFGNVDNGFYKEFQISLALIYWVSGFFSGSILLGFTEIIKLLQKLVNIGIINRSENLKNQTIITEEFNDLPEL